MKISSPFSILLLTCVYNCVYGIPLVNEVPAQDYDSIVFSQKWSVATCFSWQHKVIGNNCSEPYKKRWLINSIWPARFFLSDPTFCNSSHSFELETLDSIRDELNLKWKDIDENAKPGQSWQREWKMRGTCSADHENLNTPEKYFKKGLDLFNQYSMKRILTRAAISPGEYIAVDDVLAAVQDSVGTLGFVGCTEHPVSGEKYLSEVNICFDKTFNPIDCDKNLIKAYPCPKGMPIKYLKSIPKRVPAEELHAYDFFVFSQHWPQTQCFQWLENRKTDMCVSKVPNHWIIHGLWPNKLVSFGPFSCHPEQMFNITKLNEIKDELKTKWADLKNDSPQGSFWRHEWIKHGTCITDSPSTDAQLQYFKTNLELSDRYNLTNILVTSNISPGQNVSLSEIQDAVKRATGTTCVIACFNHPISKKSYLTEIRLCMDKTFKPRDCDGIMNYPTTCENTNEIIYTKSYK